MSKWDFKKFSDLYSESSKNGLTKPKKVRGAGFPFINMGELFRYDRIINPKTEKAPVTDKELQNFKLIEGDLLFARQSLVLEGAGKCSIFLNNNELTTFESHLIRVRLNKDISDPIFYYYYFRSHTGRSLIKSIVEQGAGASGIRGSDLKNLVVPCPPLPEQKAIAGVLGALDDKIDLNRRTNETLEAMARALFKDWFVDFGPTKAKMAGQPPYLAPELWALFPDHLNPTTGLPEGWEEKPLEELIDFNPRESLVKDKTAPYLDMASLPTIGANPDFPIQRDFKSGTKFRNGDALLARITPCLENGKTAFIQILDEEAIGWGSTEFIVMRTKHSVPKPFSYLIARDQNFRNHAIQSMTGTSGRQRARTDALAQYPFVFPPREVWTAFGQLVQESFSQIRLNTYENQTLTQLRDALLPKLMSGQLRLRTAQQLVEAAV